MREQARVTLAVKRAQPHPTHIRASHAKKHCSAPRQVHTHATAAAGGVEPLSHPALEQRLPTRRHGRRCHTHGAALAPPHACWRGVCGGRDRVSARRAPPAVLMACTRTPSCIPLSVARPFAPHGRGACGSGVAWHGWACVCAEDSRGHFATGSQCNAAVQRGGEIAKSDTGSAVFGRPLKIFALSSCFVAHCTELCSCSRGLDQGRLREPRKQSRNRNAVNETRLQRNPARVLYAMRMR